MKKRLIYSFVLLILMSAFSYKAHAQITSIRNMTNCTVEVVIYCYDLCIHYNTVSYILAPGANPTFPTPCAYKQGVNDIVARVCYRDVCSSPCAQVDCMPSAAGCGVGTNIDPMPYCSDCYGPSGSAVNAQYIPSLQELRIW